MTTVRPLVSTQSASHFRTSELLIVRTRSLFTISVFFRTERAYSRVPPVMFERHHKTYLSKVAFPEYSKFNKLERRFKFKASVTMFSLTAKRLEMIKSELL